MSEFFNLLKICKYTIVIYYEIMILHFWRDWLICMFEFITDVQLKLQQQKIGHLVRVLVVI